VVGYKIVEGRLDIDGSARVDDGNLTDIYQNFSVDMADSTYVGGEASAHGSCGFFYKRTGNILNWALMSLDSNPFVSVEEIDNGVAFISNTGHRWIVHGDHIEDLRIET
jgi:hypothetical protein